MQTRRLTMILLALLALAAGGATWVPSGPARVPAAGGESGIEAAWVEIGPGGRASARVITRQSGCPTIWFDADARAMAERARPAAAFPVLVCEAAIPAGTGSAWVAGRWLPLPVANPRRIVVVGDTGCRLNPDDPIQDCDNPADWPWGEVAADAAARQPDLVIHVGDYVYRDEECPADDPGCAGSPWGPNWPTWQADFFAPADPLLRAAPWVFVRGNHEVCSRHGEGWFRFLEPRSNPPWCLDYTEPYALPAGATQIQVLDSAQADDSQAVPEQVARYRAQLAVIAGETADRSWLLTHRPFWAVGQASGQAELFTSNATLQAASGNRLPAGIDFILAGHLHLFNAFSFADGRPPQFVVGNSGTELDAPITLPLTGAAVGGTTVAHATSIHEFGYLEMEPSSAGWQATLRGLDGPLAACALGRGDLECAD